MATIYHITTPETWQAGLAQGKYSSPSLDGEGFIHCSTAQQIVATANRYYHGKRGLILLALDPQRLTAELRYENLIGGSELFPHLYGPLNPDAVKAAIPFEPDPDGNFTRLPENAPGA